MEPFEYSAGAANTLKSAAERAAEGLQDERQTRYHAFSEAMGDFVGGYAKLPLNKELQ